MGYQSAVCRHWPGLVMAVSCLPGCFIEPNSGSNLEFDFAEAMQTAADRGTTPQPEQPPADTFFTLYATDFEYYDEDGNGRPDLDMNGEPLVRQAFVFEVQRFEVRKLIDRASPCFIDVEGSRFPGIHVTQVAAKIRVELGVTNPFDPLVPYNDAVDVLTADRRMELLPRLENELKAVASTDATVEPGREDFLYPATAPVGPTGCAETNPGLTDLPHPTCFDDASNALRLRLCRQLWVIAGEDFYEGSDKVYTLPLNGNFYGMVEGMNPVNDGFVGGAGIYVDENLVGHDAYTVNWQYKDLNGDGQPDAPAGMESEIGQPYLFGRSEHITRGVVNATLRNLNSRTIRGELAVFPNLGDDDVHF